MNFFCKSIICYLCFIPIGQHAFAACNSNKMVTLGADCDLNIQTGAPQTADPTGSEFVQMVESGECSGIVYAKQLMSECDAESIMLADPTGSYFIKEDVNDGSDSSGSGDSSGSSDGYYYAGTFEPITVEVKPGNNKFSIPWNWFVKFLGFADDDVYNQFYKLEDLPICDPNNLSNEYDAYSETA